MKFNKTLPCKNCPYRVDAPLELWDREEFRKLLEHDQDYFGKVYDCHKQDGSICRGYLMDQDRRNQPSIALRMMLMKYNIDRSYLDALTCSSAMYDSIEEMIWHNYPELLLEITLKNLQNERRDKIPSPFV